jgi:hypothetical protein
MAAAALNTRRIWMRLMIVVALIATPACYLIGRHYSQLAESTWSEYIGSELGHGADLLRQHRRENETAIAWGVAAIGSPPACLAAWAIGSWILFGSLRNKP